jgi:tetratricopeptide (TPR) repeat protein
LQILGQIRWKQYIDGKKAPGASERQEELQKLRTEAVTSLRGSVERQTATWRAGAEPMPPSLFDTQLLLADAHLEGQQPKEAAALYEPLIAEYEKMPPAAVDNKVQRVLVGSVRSQLAAGDPAKAGAAAVKFATLSPDAPQPNSLLVDLAKLFSIEIRKVEAAQDDGQGGATGAAPDPIAAKLREVQGQLLDLIVGRKELAVQQMIFVGDTCVLLKKNDKAREVYQRLLDSIDADPTAKETAGAATTGLRSRLVGLLRADGKLEEANKQVDALIKAHPTALGPLMEKGNILEALAQRDPKRNEECVAHWTDLRVKLGRSKTRPPEYYEALYNAARALVRQARQSKNTEKALQAEQMLKSTLTLTPKLSGPDMVAQYDALLKQAVLLRGDSKPQKTAGSSR